ncbi:MAG: tRNA (guanosine(37)-N1)-methyltransferase TrmD [Patescibacteria group bacterium]|nr:tRNA (guanosine(37)-N1)-methyltransferase TrmD [Patescibacteria group bacterium]
MQIDIITLFPNMFNGPFNESIVQRAQNKQLVKINIHNLRNWAIDKRGTVDDKPYGGGVGMVLRPEPVFQAVEYCKKAVQKPKIILLSASGIPYDQQKAQQFSKFKNLILICGHYEGVDQRVADYLVDEEITIGDYVLTGGEIPAMVIVDSVVRLIPGVLEKPQATQHESFSPVPLPTSYLPRPTSHFPTPTSHPLLEYPQYTRPDNFKGHQVPKVLLSGNHAQIEKWKCEKALERTKKFRPDLL